MIKVKRWIDGNWEILLNASILSIGIVASLVDIFSATPFGLQNTEVVEALTLWLLTFIGGSLLALNLSHKKEKENLQKEIQNLKNKLSPTLSHIVIPYDDRRNCLKNLIRLAQEVWVLARSGCGMWDDYNEQFMHVTRRRFLLINPNDGAVKMISRTMQHWPRPSHEDRYREDILALIKTLQNNNIDLRVIDYLPPYTMTFADPNSVGNGKVYIELATYSCNPDDRPAFIIEQSTDPELFTVFLSQYQLMWNDSNVP